MKCNKCGQHAVPLYMGSCYKCSSDRLQEIKQFTNQELQDELDRRSAIINRAGR